MIFKILTAVFAITTFIFAGMYSSLNATKPVIVTENIIQAPDKEVKPEVIVVEKKSIKRPRVIQAPVKKGIETVLPYSDLTEQEVKVMVELQDLLSNQNVQYLERNHPLLMSFLNLDEETKSRFKSVMGKRLMALNLHQGYTRDQDEIAEFKDRKQSLLTQIDDEIASVIGMENFQKVLDYREKSQEYHSVGMLNKRLEQNGNALDTDQQHKLAQLMSEFKGDFNGMDFRSKDPKVLEELKQKYLENKERVKDEAAGILSAEQHQAFSQQLEHESRRYDWMFKRQQGARSFRQR